MDALPTDDEHTSLDGQVFRDWAKRPYGLAGRVRHAQAPCPGYESREFSVSALRAPARLIPCASHPTVQHEICAGSDTRFVAGKPRDNRSNFN